jgi:hypothetical protein
MNDSTKVAIKAELIAVKSILPAVSSQLSMLNQVAYPIAGPMVTIPSLPAAANAIKMQGDVIDKLISIVQKIVDAS